MEKIKKAVPKFKTVFLQRVAPRDPKLKELARWCREFHAEDLTPSYGGGSYGNLSVRSNDGSFLITVSGIRLKNKLAAKDFFKVTRIDFSTSTVYGYGVKPPSSEAMLHGAIYKKRKNAGAVFHGHCREILSYGRRMNIRETEKEEPYGTRRLVAGVLKILGKQKFLIMKNHGFVSLGRSMKTAGSLALAVREACREKFE